MHVVGVGRTKFGVLEDSLPELMYQAMYNAIDNGPLPIEVIEAVYVSNFLGGAYERQLHLNSVVSSLLPELRLPIIRVETAVPYTLAASFAPRDQPRNRPLIRKKKNIVQPFSYQGERLIAAIARRSDTFSAISEIDSMSSIKYRRCILPLNPRSDLNICLFKVRP